MHRLSVSVFALALMAAGCGGKTKPADAPAGGESGDAGAGGGSGGESGDAGAEAKDECTGFEIGNLEEVLLKSSCEETGKNPDSLDPVDLKGKLEVTVGSSPTKLDKGGKAELVVSFTNKSKEPLTLHFRIDPTPRFQVEAYDKKGKLADRPRGNPPPPPKGATAPEPSEPKTARVTIAANGTARTRIPWEAVRTKWAPEKFRGTPPEMGYPRAPAGPLPKGKYTVKVITPLVGVFEGVDKEMSAPKVEIEIGG